jgi:hypothetical protein
MATATLTYSKDEPSVEIESMAQLERWFEKLAALCSPEFPGVFRLRVNGYEVELGLGLAESFVSIEHESGMPPYYMTLGDDAAEGEVGFLLFGDHRTRIPRRNLIPTQQAREVVKEYFATGERSASVRWEKMTG